MLRKKTADIQSFLQATSLSSYTGSRRRDWRGRCPRQSADASDMTGPAISSLAVRPWLDQVIARMKDWVLLSTWHIHLTHLSSPPPPFSTPKPWQPLCCPPPSTGNPGLKESSPPPPSLLYPLPLLSPEEVSGIAGISQHHQGARTSWLPSHECWRAASAAVLLLSSSCSRLIPTDRPSPLLKLPPADGGWGAC